MSAITVRSMKKKSYRMIFHNKDATEKSLSLLPLDVSWSSGIVKVGGCVDQEVFKKQLLIIKV